MTQKKTTRSGSLRNYQIPRRRVTLDCGEISRTKQSFKDECDINKIVARYKKTGTVPQTMRPKRYGEQNIDGFAEMHNQIAAVKTMFEELPPGTQDKFEDQNDFIDALSNPDREHELLDAGVAYRIGDSTKQEATSEHKKVEKTAKKAPEKPVEEKTTKAPPSTPADSEHSEAPS